MESHVLLDMGEDPLEGIGGIGNVQVGVAEVGEKVREIPLHAVIGAPNSAMGVVPSFREFIDCSLFEERSPLVVPELQP